MRLNIAKVEEDIHNYFKYDKQTGKIHRTSKQNRMLPVRKPSRTRNGKKYITYTFQRGRKCRATLYGHVIAYFMVTGVWPPEDKCIDHINGDGTDNRWENLRLVTRSENQMNRHSTVSPSGYVGVHWEPRCRKWYGKLNAPKQLYTKLCETPEEAHKLRKELMEKVHG